MVALTGNVKIGVFGHYGNRNLGDEAIITAVIQNPKRELSHATYKFVWQS